jgi:hypothetical protein
MSPAAIERGVMLVCYHDDDVIYLLVMGIGNIFKIDDRYINIDR